MPGYERFDCTNSSPLFLIKTGNTETLARSVESPWFRKPTSIQTMFRPTCVWADIIIPHFTNAPALFTIRCSFPWIQYHEITAVLDKFTARFELIGVMEGRRHKVQVQASDSELGPIIPNMKKTLWPNYPILRKYVRKQFQVLVV